jgi:hypothetical protein
MPIQRLNGMPRRMYMNVFVKQGTIGMPPGLLVFLVIGKILLLIPASKRRGYVIRLITMGPTNLNNIPLH